MLRAHLDTKYFKFSLLLLSCCTIIKLLCLLWHSCPWPRQCTAQRWSSVQNPRSRHSYPRKLRIRDCKGVVHLSFGIQIVYTCDCFQFPCHMGSCIPSSWADRLGVHCTFACPNKGMAATAWVFNVCTDITALHVTAHRGCMNSVRGCTGD